MRDHAVVLTYPGHFLLTQITIKSIEEYFPEIQRFTILADDISPIAPSTYINDCKKAYRHNVVALSQFDFLKRFASNNWVRQQMVKLHLDVILDGNSWFFSDGDIGFTSHIPIDTVPYGYINALEDPVRTNGQDNYITYLLGLETPTEWLDPKRICTSVAAFRDMYAETLNSLRQFVEQRFDLNFVDLHYSLSKDRRYAISEWELLESYRLYVLKQKTNWAFCPPRDYIEYHNPIAAGHPQPYFYTYYGTDSDLGPQWWGKVKEHSELTISPILC